MQTRLPFKLRTCYMSFNWKNLQFSSEPLLLWSIKLISCEQNRLIFVYLSWKSSKWKAGVLCEWMPQQLETEIARTLKERRTERVNPRTENREHELSEHRLRSKPSNRIQWTSRGRSKRQLGPCLNRDGSYDLTFAQSYRMMILNQLPFTDGNCERRLKIRKLGCR